MSRSSVRPVVVGAGLLAAAVAAWFILRPAAYSIESQPDRNVLLITIDTLRADALGSYGGRAVTPTLDALAAQGAQFDFAHAHAVVTLPSHTSILTGHLPYTHGVRDNSGYRVAMGTETLATRFKSAGFSTGAFIGAFPLLRRFGLAQGFDEYDDQISELQGDRTQTVPERPAPEVVARATSWIDRTPGRFFAWVHVFDPHFPYAPPSPHRETYADQPYLGEVAAVDQALAPLVERLRTLTRPTLVIVTSDHGESLGEHGEQTHGLFAYEATLRVPLIVATIDPSGAAPRGRRIASPVRHVDIAPTLTTAAGLTPDPSWPGQPLQPVIAAGGGDDRPSYFESMTYHLTRGWAPLRGVVVDRDKFIDQPIAELYDLATDPGELRNSASSRADRAQVLRGVLRTFNTELPNAPGRESAAVSETLRSLGYVSGSTPQRDRYTEADDYKNLVGINRDLQSADEAFQKGEFDRVVALTSAVIALRPDTVDAITTMARAHWARGDAPSAVAVIDQALARGLQHQELRLRLGIYLAESGLNPTRAVAILRTLPDDDVEGLNALGLAYGAANQPAEALATFSRILAIDPGNGLALQNMAAVELKRGNVVAAEQLARQAVDQDPGLAKAYTTLGVALVRAGKVDDAIGAWSRAVQLEPTEFDALYNLVVLLADRGRIGDARRFASQFVQTAPRGLYAKEIAQFEQLLR
jgi:arylsulfatase A-like enzyme/Tfp pilus assembly protein PilF